MNAVVIVKDVRQEVVQIVLVKAVLAVIAIVNIKIIHKLKYLVYE